MSEEATLAAVGRRYPICQEVGRGGMSVVYEATDPRIGRKVAVKLLHPHLASRADARRRFLQEATAIARLENPHILKIYDYDSPDDQTSYIISEFVEGVTLKSWVEQHPVRCWELVALLALPLFRALAHAHEQGIIHRDVKPENIMIRAQTGAPVLMDFGIAHVIDSETLTATGAMIGSPAHMAPEVVNGEPLTYGADIFSMGTVLYWMTCGSLPFVAPNPAALFRRILEVRFDPVRSRRPEVLAGFAELIEECMRREPAERPASALEIAERIETLLSFGGLDDYDDLLSECSRDPAGFQTSLSARLVPQYCERAHDALREHDVTLAQSLYEYISQLAPESPHIHQLKVEISRAMRQRRSAHFSLASLGALLLGAGLMLWLGSAPLDSRGRTSSSSDVRSSAATLEVADLSTSTASLDAGIKSSQEKDRSALSPINDQGTRQTLINVEPTKPRRAKVKRKKGKRRINMRRPKLGAKLRARASQLDKSRVSRLKRLRAQSVTSAKKGLSSIKETSRPPQGVQRVKVSSRYKGAQVLVDGTEVGHIYQLDTLGGVDLSIGARHEVTFRSPFCEEQRKVFFFKTKLPQPPQVVFECIYKPATIMIRSAQDAEVLLDGPKPRLLGRTNQVITYPLERARVEVELIVMGAQGQSQHRKLSLEAGQRREVRW